MEIRKLPPAPAVPIVRTRIALLGAICLSCAMAVIGCGGGSSSTPPPHNDQITVAFTTAPPTSLNTGATASMVATVTNDSSNEGVDWSCSPTGSCGSFNPAHTASGAATTFTAPAAAGSVTITAICTARPSTTVSANVTINATAPPPPPPNNPGLAGVFSFFVRGTESNARVYSLAGAVTLQADGTITTGVQDFNDGSASNQSPVSGDTINGGSYTLGDDGRGTLTLMTNNTNLGSAGKETFHIVKVNDKHLLMIQFDGAATSSGSMDLQSATPGLTALSGAYSFAVTGRNGTTTESFGGSITADGAGGLKVIVDSNENGTLNRGANTGTYTAQDSFGRGTMAFGGNTFVYYAVHSETGRTNLFRLLVTNSTETDVGTAVLQADQATSFDTSFVKGKFVLLGASNHAGNEGFVTAGQFTADGAGNITGGFGDEIEGGTTNDLINGDITGTYTLPANGLGTLTVTFPNDHHRFALYPSDPDVNLLDPNNEGPDGKGGALLMALDSHAGDGVLVPQGTTGAPSGNFAINFHAFTNTGEIDGVGQIVVNNGAITGSADVNDLVHSAQSAGATFSGTLTADAANPGRFTVPLGLTISGTATTQTIVAYQISAEQFVLIQVDPTQFASGILEKQGESTGTEGVTGTSRRP